MTTSQQPWQTLTARALQGADGAIDPPTALALITTTFHEGPGPPPAGWGTARGPRPEPGAS
ncbi:hypothetical protein [Streptomyces enissocaesilis]|uniref:Uncharacterized protein n=1 Tax=Streptomyces enissocaesilis TaxID=332589 RepID=A0ABN3WU83_9ACTN